MAEYNATGATPSGNVSGVIVQSPKITQSGEPTQRSIRDAAMGRDIVKLIMQAGRNRAIVGSRILAKYNAERPYDAYKLEQEGLGWKQNFTTKPLPLMIEKVAPRFVQAVDGLKYFTNSSLSDKWQNVTEKSEFFQKTITDTIRGRKGWKTLLEDLAFNNALFGYAVAAWLDNYTWFPTAFAFDESFLPDGTKQQVQYCQVAILKEVYLPHELFKKIKDREAAEATGWNLKSTINQINNASPMQIRDRLVTGGTLEFWYQNAIRELTIGASYMSGASVIVVYTLLAREVTGKISHYRFAGTEMEEIFSNDDQFDSAEDCMAFFAFQKGNGTMHGSKGIGRDIYELAGMLDRTRNEIVDRSILSGKTMFQGDPRRIHTFKMNVIGASVIIPNGWTLLEQKIDGDVEPFLRMDAYFTALVDQLIGNVSTNVPPALQGEAGRSPAAWNLMASREEEGKDVRITRFMEQFVTMVQTMQRRICDPDTIDDDAKAAQKRLLDVMTREEIDELAKKPVAETVRDLTPMERQMIVSIANEKKGNPLYNNRALEVEDLTARIDASFANRVLLPDNDPTVAAEQQRLQQMELELLNQGQPVPVSIRDNHAIHLQMLMPIAEQTAGAMMQGQSHTQVFEAIVAHITEHFNRAQSQGAKRSDPLMKAVGEFVAKAGPQIAKLKELDAHAAQLAQASAAHDAEGQQIISGGGPPAPGSPPQPPTPQQ